ncbi:uncharacterized protein [Rutidosis leptorrhynchoides]|uniref:uncharacterized protein n=1 Tax=Rutidosis leptorrhynchoides TaxID=125765 RepID=UPI003A98DA11
MLSFWNSRWATEARLSGLFPRLFRLEVEKDAAIRERVVVTTTSNRLSGNWTRLPSRRTSRELDNLNNLIENYEFTVQGGDTCFWKIAHTGIFTIRSLSLVIDNQLIEEDPRLFETLRNNLVPKKLEIFVWRARQKRLPVMKELDKRGIDLNSVRCPLCDDDLETVDHSLIFCKCAMDVWDRVFDWWGFGSMANFSIDELFRGNGPTSASTLGKKIWQAVEWVCAYLI